MSEHANPEASEATEPATGESAAPAPTAPEISPEAEQSAPPAETRENDDQSWMLISHFGASVILVLTLGTFGWLAGLLTLFLKGNSPAVRPHAVESTNFQLTWGIFTIINVLLGMLTSWTCMGVLFALAALLSGGFALVMSIIAGRQAQAGRLYRYPVSFRIIQ